MAYLGDKRFLWNGDRSAFVMYAPRGKSHVALGDPVGPAGAAPALIEGFVRACAVRRARPVFYNIGPDALETYLAQGMSLYKIGEEARFELPGFSLGGGAFVKMRQLLHRYEKEGARFEVLSPADGAAAFARLKQVSDRWLASRRGREKGFSMGVCKAEFLARFPIATLSQGDKVLAFTNVLATAGKEEVSGDLVRFLPEGPSGAMDALFLHLMLWAKESGYKWFSLGMAPLSGLRSAGFSPLWNRLGTFVFQHGEPLYRFRGLRSFKEKFHPRWFPRYLACPGGWRLPRAMADAAALIGGGWRGVLSRRS